MSNEIDKAVDQYLTEQGITYEAKFRRQVPESKKPSDLQIKWYTFFNGECFDFFTGIAHMPKPMYEKYGRLTRYTQRDWDALCLIVCDGRYPATAGTSRLWSDQKCFQPTAASVLYCLLSDSDVENYRTYDEWASDLGYDPDSRSGEQTFNACLQNTRALRRAIGSTAIEKLREMLQDY